MLTRRYKGALRKTARSLKRCLDVLWSGIPEGRVGAAAAVSPDTSCVRCGLCCIDLLVKLTTRDIRALASGLGVSNHDVLRKYVKMTSIGPVLRQTGNRCIFLNDGDEGLTVACSVYVSRPEVCRDWIPSLSRLECQEGLRRLAEGRSRQEC